MSTSLTWDCRACACSLPMQGAQPARAGGPDTLTFVRDSRMRHARTLEKCSGTGKSWSRASRMPLSQRALKCSQRTRSTHLHRQAGHVLSGGQ